MGAGQAHAARIDQRFPAARSQPDECVRSRAADHWAGSLGEVGKADHGVQAGDLCALGAYWTLPVQVYKQHNTLDSIWRAPARGHAPGIDGAQSLRAAGASWRAERRYPPPDPVAPETQRRAV